MFHSLSANKKTYELIIEQIMELIRGGKLKKGDRLPSERQLCEQLGVGRTSLKQAISSLCAMGIVESRHGEGNYISENLSIDLLIPFTAQFFLSNCKIYDLVQIRYIIETQIIRTVSMKITDAQIAHLQKMVDRMGDIQGDAPRADANMAFHKYLVDVFGNELLSNIYDGISSLISHQVMMADGINFHQNHQNLLDALKAHDLELSYRLMKEHFEEKYREMEEDFFRFY